MEIIICENRTQACSRTATLVVSQIKNKPNSVLGLATGSTPKEVYQRLIEKFESGDVDFSRTKSFNLDEYVGLAADHPAAYSCYMKDNLFSKINILRHNTFIPDGLAKDIPGECQAYENKIQSAGGIDLQLLGIGSDGHIGFNEPTSSLVSRTRIKSLTEETIKDNARYFDSEAEIPRHVITMGVGTIMSSKRIVLLAFGEGKADAVAAMVEGPLTSMVPASVLQTHQKVSVLLDREAAAKLKKQDYYNWVFANKPDWQKEF